MLLRRGGLRISENRLGLVLKGYGCFHAFVTGHAYIHRFNFFGGGGRGISEMTIWSRISRHYYSPFHANATFCCAISYIWTLKKVLQ